MRCSDTRSGRHRTASNGPLSGEEWSWRAGIQCRRCMMRSKWANKTYLFVETAFRCGRIQSAVQPRRHACSWATVGSRRLRASGTSTALVASITDADEQDDQMLAATDVVAKRAR